MHDSKIRTYSALNWQMKALVQSLKVLTFPKTQEAQMS